MPGGGPLAIGTADVDIDADGAALHAGAAPGRYVALTVTDNGVGMDAETRAHLFSCARGPRDRRC
jgi:signal transduction histidine kinase